METKIKIYKLINPILNQPFYIGKTSKTLDERLKQHISCSVSPRCPVHCYIYFLLDSGFKPSIELIDECEYCDGDNLEMKNINDFSKNYKLCNVTGNDKKKKDIQFSFKNNIGYKIKDEYRHLLDITSTLTEKISIKDYESLHEIRKRYYEISL